jgi:hypothetical protein
MLNNFSFFLHCKLVNWKILKEELYIHYRNSFFYPFSITFTLLFCFQIEKKCKTYKNIQEKCFLVQFIQFLVISWFWPFSFIIFLLVNFQRLEYKKKFKKSGRKNGDIFLFFFLLSITETKNPFFFRSIMFVFSSEQAKT